MDTDPQEKIRLDKWLWSVRIFKTRSKSAEECRSGHVKLESKTLKPSYLVGTGDTLFVKRNGYNMVYRVTKLISKRVGAPIAITCYEDLTPADELNKFQDWFIGKARGEFRQKGEGRPTKKERRDIDDYKINQYYEE